MINSSPNLSISNIHTTPHAISIGLGDIVQSANTDQRALEEKLLSDKTKTKQAKALFSAEAGEKRLKKIWHKVIKKQDELKCDMFAFNKKIDSEKKIHGTTDYLLLSNYGQIIKDFKVSEIMDLSREGDQDALRAVLLIPALRMKPQFKKAKDLFSTELEKLTLGDEDYQALQDLRTQQDDANRMEVGVLQTCADYEDEVKRIKETVVAPDEMPEVG